MSRGGVSQPAVLAARRRGSVLGATVLAEPETDLRRPPVAKPGTPWERLSPAQRRAVALQALEGGRGPRSVATDYCVRPGTSAYNSVLRYFRNLSALGERLTTDAAHSRAVSVAPPVASVGVLVGALTDRTCRWPLWEHDVAVPSCLVAKYCGAATGGRPPYCAHHSHVMLRRPVAASSRGLGAR